MFRLSSYLTVLAVLIGFATATWGISLWRRNVAIVDSIWSLMFLVAAGCYFIQSPVWDLPGGSGHLPGPDTRRLIVLALVALWAIRLSLYITARNWGHGEDRRYVAIRERNQPYFEFKSLYLVFWFQAVLAWIISLPLLGAMFGSGPLGWLDVIGVALFALGLFFETVGDWQLARFKADPANNGRVMDRGLWRYTRHPNYFGDFCVWWGFYLIAVSTGAWWSIVGPLLMSALLIKYSGAGLLEQDIGERRPKYAEYIRRTNAFFPGPRRGT